MSYRQNYSGNVQYSGSVSYSYPASQNGGSGTAPYSGSVPVNVAIYVDTDPFDGSVSRFNTSIGALGASVTAMHAAQCAAIKKTAEEVSAALINGFFGTINTELSQQIQALDSAIKANFGLIQQQGKAVSEKKGVMEGDYNRIASRYVKIFADLDNECHKRINALDKQSFVLSEKVQNQLLTESSSNAAAMNFLGIEEVSSSKTLIFVSSLNRKVLNVLRTLHDYIAEDFLINSLFDTFLFNDEPDEHVPVSIPVIWVESDMLADDATAQECYISDHIDQERKRVIMEKVNMFCNSVADASHSEWKTIEESEKESLGREFNALMEFHFANVSDEMTHRVYRMMLTLWYNTQLSSLLKERSY